MRIAALLPTHQHITDKRKSKRIDIKNYFGLKVIINEIQLKLKLDVEIIDYKDVSNYDIILFSFHSIADYYALVYTIEKKIKSKKNNIWICGGAGIANLNPLVKYFDYIVLGRGEVLIIELINAIKNKNKISNDSIVVCSKYDINQVYKINYASKLYQDEKNILSESMYGCKYNCFYCHYRYSTLPPNLRKEDNKTTMPGNEETFWDLEIKNGSFYTSSLDGITEEIRYKVNKPISNKMVVDKLVKASKITKTINLKLYFIIGYPYEQEVNFTELYNIFNEVDSLVSVCSIFINLHFTPFAASPLTPMKWERVNINFDYRAMFDEMRLKDKYLYNGRNVRVMFMRTTIKPLELLKRMVYYRAGLEDLEIIKYLATATEQITHNKNNTQKLELIKERFDLNKFVDERVIGTSLECDNIKSWQEEKRIIKQAHKYRNSVLN